MTQAQIKSLTYEDYIEDYPEDGGLYELIDGRIVEFFVHVAVFREGDQPGRLALQPNVEVSRSDVDFAR